MIIDAHAHIYEYVKPYGPLGEGRAIGKGRVRWPNGVETRFFPEEYGDYGFLPESLLKIMKKNHVDKAVLLQAQNYGYHNDFVSETVKKYPDKFIGACIFDPYAVHALSLFQHFTEVSGFHILKFEISEDYGLTGIHPDLSLDSTLFAPVWDWADNTHTVTVIDTGVRNTKNWQLYPIGRIKKQHPNLQFVIAHSLFPCNDGYNDTRLRMISEIAGENIFFDISNVIPDNEPYPFLKQQKYLRSLCDMVGAEHLIWGTDLPSVLFHFSYSSLLGYLRDGKLFSEYELDWIYGKTAHEVYEVRPL